MILIGQRRFGKVSSECDLNDVCHEGRGGVKNFPDYADRLYSLVPWNADGDMVKIPKIRKKYWAPLRACMWLQASLGRGGKQEQEQTSPNHVPYKPS